VVWPAYLDAEKSRSQGRMVPRDEAIREPKVDEIAYAAIELGLDPEVERDKCFPNSWYERPGRVLVLKKGAKSALLRRICRSIRKKRR